MHRDEFFQMLLAQSLAPNPNRIRLETRTARFHPKTISLRTKYSKNISLNIPVVSAAMDTVTEAAMAITMAQEGGLGIIHRNLNPQKQAEEVERTKYHSIYGVIEKPVCIFEDEVIQHVLNRREEKRYSFHSFLVLSRETGKLAGVLTRQDIRFCRSPDTELVRDVMTQDPVLAMSDISAGEAYIKMRDAKVKLLPLVKSCKNREVVGLRTLHDVERLLDPAKLDNYGPDGRLRVAAAIGIFETDPDTQERVARLVQAGADVLKIDLAHGASEEVFKTVTWIKNNYPTIDVVAGNVSGEESAHDLVEAGVDGICVGQGPGSACISSKVKGTGLPLPVAIYRCMRVASQNNVPVVADGGLFDAGDILKMLAIGADSCVMGRRFAGTDEAPGDIEEYEDGRRVKHYRGMGSLEAIRNRNNTGSRSRYRQGEEEILVEGVEIPVPYVGPARKVTAQLSIGIRKGMFEIGVQTIASLREKVNFYLGDL